jgi:murein DD-endopeptidase MepM/ murein hydrolase activator NlpD
MSAGPCQPAPDVQGGWQITSYFGGRTDPISGKPGTHGGQDLAYAGCKGAELYAPSAGTLSQSWDSSGGGNWSGITLDDGSYCGLGHALSFAPGASYRRVAAGELIAYCDSSGGSTGDHVHVAYRPAGASSYSDPYDLLADSQHRISGGDMPLSPADLDQIEGVVQGVINSALATMYTGQRAVSEPDDPRVFEVLHDGEGRLVRRYIGHPDEIRLLRYIDGLAEADSLGGTRMITDAGMLEQFRKLPVV